jgi:L-iditol 2-dehydrogenase
MKTHGMLVLDTPEPPHDVAHGEVELAELELHDVLVKTAFSGICRSDIELIDGFFDAWVEVPYPIVPGHEYSGEVVDVGSAVTRWTPGDRVVGEGQDAHADRRWVGLTFHGASAEHVVMSDHMLHPLPAGMTLQQGATVEPFTVAYRALSVAGGCDGSDVALVLGGGMIGQCCAALARANSAFTILVEPLANRRNAAEGLGVDLTTEPLPIEDLLALVRDATGRDGVDLVFEATGAPVPIADALEVVREHGTVLSLGIAADPAITTNIGLIMQKQLRVIGSIAVSDAGKYIWPRALRFLDRHQLDLTPLVTHTFPFDQSPQAIAAARDRETAIKVMTTP